MLKNNIFGRLKSKIILGRFLNKKTGIKTLPLIYPDKKICLFVNEKSGCTFATKWLFFHLGILDEAMEYDNWIHKYRYDIYYKQDRYRLNFISIFSNKYTRMKLVRSPYQRAVSSYIHAIRTRYATQELSRFLDREVNDENTFTFEEFVAYLEKTGVRKCNPHHRAQAEKAELTGYLKIDRVVKLEGSIAEFRRIEDEYCLKPSDLDSLSKSAHHHNRIESNEYCGDRKFSKREKNFNQYQSFYNDELKDKIANLYASDFYQYNYPVDEL